MTGKQGQQRQKSRGRIVFTGQSGQQDNQDKTTWPGQPEQPARERRHVYIDDACWYCRKLANERRKVPMDHASDRELAIQRRRVYMDDADLYKVSQGERGHVYANDVDWQR